MKNILISQRVDIIESYNERRDALDQKWAHMLYKAGYVGIPVFNDANTIAELLKTLKIDGILLTGGNSPVEYGGSAPERDNTDSILIKHAIEKNIPLLGVCRGMQSIVLYFGGNLCKVQGHVAVRHDLNINRNVNSYHEYSPTKLPRDLQILAKSDDNNIEYIKHITYPIVGIMWHPERENPFLNNDIEIIKGVFK